MDYAGIDTAVFSKAFLAANVEDALEECWLWNDQASDLIRDYPGRFVGLSPIPPLGGEHAFAELDRAIGPLGFKDVMIGSQVDGLTLDSHKLCPFYESVGSF